MAPEVGSVAPDFTLKNQDNTEVTLSSFRGVAPVLLVFYPFAFSRICTGELRELRDGLGSYTAAGVEVMAISTDPTYALKAYAEQDSYRFTLLSDFWPHGAVSVDYGVFNDKAGMAVRGTFLLDVEGAVTFAEVNGRGEPRDQSSWVRAVEALRTVG
ncbi:MAG: peroxiredoxin [Actinomycetota bacterium]|nr:peroxiredoxin [Actinomycetota bacterium]